MKKEISDSILDKQESLFTEEDSVGFSVDFGILEMENMQIMVDFN